MKKQTKTYQGRALIYLILAIVCMLCLTSIARDLLANDFFTSDSFTRKDFLKFHLGMFLLIGTLHYIHTIFTVFSLEDSVTFKIIKIVFKWRIWNLKLFSVLLLSVSIFNYGIYYFSKMKFHSFLTIAVVVGFYVLTLTFVHPRLTKHLEKQKLKNKKPES